MVQVMGRQLELMDNIGKTNKVDVQDVKITYLINDVIRCLPYDKAFGHSAKHHLHLKCL